MNDDFDASKSAKHKTKEKNLISCFHLCLCVMEKRAVMLA